MPIYNSNTSNEAEALRPVAYLKKKDFFILFYFFVSRARHRKIYIEKQQEDTLKCSVPPPPKCSI